MAGGDLYWFSFALLAAALLTKIVVIDFYSVYLAPFVHNHFCAQHENTRSNISGGPRSDYHTVQLVDHFMAQCLLAALTGYWFMGILCGVLDGFLLKQLLSTSTTGEGLKNHTQNENKFGKQEEENQKTLERRRKYYENLIEHYKKQGQRGLLSFAQLRKAASFSMLNLLVFAPLLTVPMWALLGWKERTFAAWFLSEDSSLPQNSTTAHETAHDDLRRMTTTRTDNNRCFYTGGDYQKFLQQNSLRTGARQEFFFLKNLDFFQEFINFLIHAIAISIHFYASHFLIHYSPYLYTKIHKKHHEFKAPAAVCSMYAHPLEFLFGNLHGVVLGPFLTNCHPYACFFWICFSLISTGGSHSGYWMFGCRMHDDHHLFFNCNYGVGDAVDWLLGTMYQQPKQDDVKAEEPVSEMKGMKGGKHLERGERSGNPTYENRADEDVMRKLRTK